MLPHTYTPVPPDAAHEIEERPPAVYPAPSDKTASRLASFRSPSSHVYLISVCCLLFALLLLLVCTGGLLFMLFASRRCGSLDNDGCDWFRSVLRSDRAVTSAKLSGNDPIEGGHTGGADTSNSTNMSIPIDNATIADGASITYDSSVTEFASAESVGSLPEPSVVFTPSVMNLSTWSHLTGVCLDGLRVGCWEPVNITAEYSGEEQPSQEEKWSWMPQSQCPKAHIWPNLTAATPAVPRQSAVSCLPHRHFPSFLAQRCLVNRWIVFVGDSSTRFLYSAFVQLLSARREPLSVVDYHMPAYTSCPCTADSLRGAVDKRQCCANWYKGLEGNETVVLGTEDHGTSWFRERLVHTPHGLIRATFFFKTFADAKVGSFEAIITPPSQQSGGAIAHPDLVVLNTGAWDSYKKHNTSITVSATRAFVDDIRSKTTAPLLWMTLPHCHSPFAAHAESVNAGHRQLMSEKRIPVLPREETTWQFLDDPWVKARGEKFADFRTQCEGWHAHRDIAEAHVQMLLNSVCETPMEDE